LEKKKVGRTIKLRNGRQGVDYQGHVWLLASALPNHGPAKFWRRNQPPKTDQNLVAIQNGGLAHGQWPIFGLATQESHPNTLQMRKFGASF